jgi:hypothetical protein
MATITMVGGLLGRRTLAIYLVSIVSCTLLAAFVTDMIYMTLGISAKVSAGASAAELLPRWVEWTAAVILAALIARVAWMRLEPKARRLPRPRQAVTEPSKTACSCEVSQAGST